MQYIIKLAVSGRCLKWWVAEADAGVGRKTGGG